MKDPAIIIARMARSMLYLLFEKEADMARELREEYQELTEEDFYLYFKAAQVHCSWQMSMHA